jgi:hypothetical protein
VLSCICRSVLQTKYEQIATDMVNKLVSQSQRQQQVQQQQQPQQVQGMQMQQPQLMQPQMQPQQALTMQQPGMQGASCGHRLALDCEQHSSGLRTEHVQL